MGFFLGGGVGGVTRDQNVSHSAVLDFKRRRSAVMHHDDSERSYRAANKPAKIRERPPPGFSE